MDGEEPGAAGRLLRRVDDAQQRRSALAFPVAVAKKFGDDRAGQLAALIAYYGFFSLFPLLLVFATVVAIVVRDDPELQAALVDSALRQFPVVGTKIGESIEELSGSPITLVVGIAGALWSGTAVVTAAQHAMDEVWDVPRAERPAWWRRALRALVLLSVVAAAIAASAFLAGLGDGEGAVSLLGRVLAGAVVLAVSVGLFAVAYRVLTVAEVRWREVLPGSIVAGVGWGLLLLVGSWIVDRQIRDASQAYGFFAIVIGLLTWIFLVAQVFVAGAEVNVVRARRLWPRSLVDPPLREEDERVLAAQAREERARPGERIDVRFGDRRTGAGSR
ncbi:MAG TPA: YihY/virulence factor BrkB family protein [Actinomycetota bacterium]|nr:YihY/virulence factor BrkB family protein [Actinomycetota bacterium]